MSIDEKHEWNDCPEGAITEMVGGIRRHRRHLQVRRLGTVVCVAVIGLVASFAAIQQMGEAREISCRDVLQLRAEYAAGRLGKSQSSRVAAHLEKCPHCRKHYGRQESGRRVTGAEVALLSVVLSNRFATP